MTTQQENINPNVTLDAGTYEIIRKRLENQGEELQSRMHQLNEARKETFGAIASALLATERITTENNCIPRDMMPVGKVFLFGYNVHIGLKSEVSLSDVFSIYEFNNEDHSFRPLGLELISDKRFESDFKELYKYYKNTVFAKFVLIGNYLYFKFRVGKDAKDIKAFKFLKDGDKLVYVDNRSEHEIQFPPQHEFEWVRTHRDLHREGDHPHISILDKVFVETVGGDLTIKVEDNTDSGEGIYSEEVEQKEQTLDDAEIFYADLGNLILLKMRPYQEKKTRYFVFNVKLKEVHRIDAIDTSCVLLPDEQGILFSKGYYLQNGELKIFENSLTDMRFEKRIQSPNGEDYLYVFYSQKSGDYVLLSYNRIEQEVNSPIVCSGFSFFFNGELIYFKADHEPKKHHTIQLWQTPYVHPDYVAPVHTENYLYKVGNKDIVVAMAECHEVTKLIAKEEAYSTIYLDIARKSGEIIDSYYWLDNEETFNLKEALQGLKSTANSAVEEFDKVTRVRQNTAEQTKTISGKAETLIASINRQVFKDINAFVVALSELRTVRGEVISLKELRYVNLGLVESLENQLQEKTEKVSQKCVEFLLNEEALLPYSQKVEAQKQAVEQVEKVVEADKTQEENDRIGKELEMLIEIVSNLKIEDATQTTRIIDSISAIYANLNNVKAQLKNKRKSLLSTEAKAEFSAQLKLINQAVVNYLDVSDSPQRCEEYLTKLMVQLEELEGKFADFNDFLIEITEKRDEIYNAFESKKLSLVDARNKRTTSLQSAAERILKGIENRLSNFAEVNEINGYFASDLMVDKVRDIVKQLRELEDNVKADDLQSRLKTIREEAVRQLKDRQDLFTEGENIITLGKHKFSVNVQDLDATMVFKNGQMYYHLSGTNFFELVENEQLLATQTVWEQTLISENPKVYRGEYLAYQILKSLSTNKEYSIETLANMSEADLLTFVQKFMAPRYQEGYVKGVHDQDTAKILAHLVSLESQISLLKYAPEVRACAQWFWDHLEKDAEKTLFNNRIKGLGAIMKIFPDNVEYQSIVDDLAEKITVFSQETDLFGEELAIEAATYLFLELSSSDSFVVSPEAAALYQGFGSYLKRKKIEETYATSINALKNNSVAQFELIFHWLKAYVNQESSQLFPNSGNSKEAYLTETAVLLLTGNYQAKNIIEVSVEQQIEGMSGEHGVIEKNIYSLNYHHFMQKLKTYTMETVPLFHQFTETKKALTDAFRKQVRLEEFKPRVLSSFVRNKLIDEVYLPLIGDNLAKQIGVVGENKRTDLMGMLLLISPPGYGKTTLMEYISNRLGLIFMKINGPAIGHQVTSLDPAEATNASAKEELKKLNLAFEMGDNVMIYVDDIQHCNPEFLQKFISLSDGQRKIEGVYKDTPKTYDLRGRRVCVVMAGNPYTESGDKFQIPDMLANRADTYNLGDIIGDTERVFRLSYLENSLTSNAVLNKLSGKSRKDIHSVIRIAETGEREGVDFESNISGEELNEYVSILEKMLVVRDVILKVNLQYIQSAAQADEYRTEPSFKLQGSYRNMNKIAEKLVTVMNEQELKTLVMAHYEGEAQTLTTGAEANLLKFRELVNWQENEHSQRWEEIKATFQKNQKLKGFGQNNQMTQLLEQINAFTEGLEGIRKAIEGR